MKSTMRIVAHPMRGEGEPSEASPPSHLAGAVVLKGLYSMDHPRVGNPWHAVGFFLGRRLFPWVVPWVPCAALRGRLCAFGPVSTRWWVRMCGSVCHAGHTTIGDTSLMAPFILKSSSLISLIHYYYYYYDDDDDDDDDDDLQPLRARHNQGIRPLHGAGAVPLFQVSALSVSAVERRGSGSSSRCREKERARWERLGSCFFWPSHIVAPCGRRGCFPAAFTHAATVFGSLWRFCVRLDSRVHAYESVQSCTWTNAVPI